MKEQLQRITSLLAQSCATYPSGKRGVFEAMEALEGKTLKESSLYAALNSNPTAPDTLKVSQLISVMRVTADVSALRFLAAMFGYSLVAHDASEPDAPTIEAEMLQDFPAVVRFHEIAQSYIDGNASVSDLLQSQEHALSELRQTTAKTVEAKNEPQARQ